MNSQIDVRDVLPSVHVPTLVLHRAGDLDSSVGGGRYIAERIPGARFVELPGVDHCPWIDADDIVDEIQQFLTGERRPPRTQRVLATIMFTDIVRSTERAVRVGDSDWTALLSAHDGAVRRELDRFAGEEVDDGRRLPGRFRRPGAGDPLGLAVSRTAANSGWRCVPGSTPGRSTDTEDVHGVAVHTAARIMSEAGPEEVLVSATTMDLVAGSRTLVSRSRRA